METTPIDVTAILAKPREFARRYENLRAALDAARRELAEWRRVNEVDTRRSVKRALSARAVARYARRMRAERDAARAEVARLTAALAEYEKGRWHSFETVQALAAERDSAAAEIERLTAALESEQRTMNAMLQAITEEANAEGIRAAKAEALIKAHNERVEAACKWRQENDHCDYAKRGDLCPDCPKEWEIENE